MVVAQLAYSAIKQRYKKNTTLQQKKQFGTFLCRPTCNFTSAWFTLPRFLK